MSILEFIQSIDHLEIEHFGGEKTIIPTRGIISILIDGTDITLELDNNITILGNNRNIHIIQKTPTQNTERNEVDVDRVQCQSREQ